VVVVLLPEIPARLSTKLADLQPRMQIVHGANPANSSEISISTFGVAHAEYATDSLGVLTTEVDPKGGCLR
jgi:hypothetical protein